VDTMETTKIGLAIVKSDVKDFRLCLSIQSIDTITKRGNEK